MKSAEKLWANGTPLMWTKLTAYLLKHAEKTDFLEGFATNSKKVSIINHIAEGNYNFLDDETNESAVFSTLLYILCTFDGPVLIKETRLILKAIGMFADFLFIPMKIVPN